MEMGLLISVCAGLVGWQNGSIDQPEEVHKRSQLARFENFERAEQEVERGKRGCIGTYYC